jgi:hypothetical protein
MMVPPKAIDDPLELFVYVNCFIINSTVQGHSNVSIITQSSFSASPKTVITSN